MKSYALLAFCIFYISICNVFAVPEIHGDAIYKNVTILIEHALKSSQYLQRSSIQLITKADGKQGLLIPSNNGIGADLLPEFKQLLDSNGMYTIRIRAAASASSIPSILTSIPAVCAP